MNERIFEWYENAIVFIGLLYHNLTGGMSSSIRWFAGWNVRQVIKEAIENKDIGMLQILTRPDPSLGDIVGGQTMYEFAQALTSEQNTEFKQAMRDTLEDERPRIDAALAALTTIRAAETQIT